MIPPSLPSYLFALHISYPPNFPFLWPLPNAILLYFPFTPSLFRLTFSSSFSIPILFHFFLFLFLSSSSLPLLLISFPFFMFPSASLFFFPFSIFLHLLYFIPSHHTSKKLQFHLICNMHRWSSNYFIYPQSIKTLTPEFAENSRKGNLLLSMSHLSKVPIKDIWLYLITPLKA